LSDTTTRFETRLRRWFVKKGSDAHRRPQSEDEAWEQWVGQMRAFVGAVLRQPPRPEIRAERRERLGPRLPFDLFLCQASRSQRIYAGGSFDPFTCYERQGVTAFHDVEFLTRLSFQDRGSERYDPFGVIRLYRGGSRLPRLADARRLWESLRIDYGLREIPPASWLLQSEPLEVRAGEQRTFRRRVTPPRSARVFARVGMRRYFYSDVLQILRERLSATQTVAWMEAAFQAPLRPGEIRHRYYLTRGRQVLLVRHHWRDGKRMFRAETSEEARRLCASSGAFRRLRIAA
jgi:hypothetical protein